MVTVILTLPTIWAHTRTTSLVPPPSSLPLSPHTQIQQQQQQQQQQQLAPSVSYASSDLLMGICCSLSLLSSLSSSLPEDVLRATLLGPLVKLLNRAAREVCATQQNAQMHQQHYQATARFNQ